MYRFLLSRLAATIPVLLGVSFLVFMMLHLVPGDPVKMMLSEFQTSPQQVQLLRSQLHLDEPLPKQYGRYIVNAARGDLGLSIRSKRPVRSEIGENLGSTLQLAVAALLVAAVVGVTLGALAAIKQNTWLDFAPMVLARAKGLRAADVANIVTPYPSLADATRGAAAQRFAEVGAGWLGGLGRRIAAWSQ